MRLCDKVRGKRGEEVEEGGRALVTLVTIRRMCCACVNTTFGVLVDILVTM
jgi:hypothetical protein